MISIILVFALGLLCHVYQCYRMRKLPPYFEGALPIIGHTFMFLTAKNYFNLISSVKTKMLERKQEHGTIKLGTWIIYVIASPDDANLFAYSNLTKDVTNDYFKPFLGEGLLTAAVPKWKIHRKLLNPTFNQQVLDGYLYEINNQTRQMLETMTKEVGRGPFDHHNHYINEAILQIVCATSMGTITDEEDRHTREMFIKALQCFLVSVFDRVVKFWLHSDLIFQLTGRKKQQDMLADEMNFFSQAILAKKKTEFLSNKNRIVDSMSGKQFKPFIEMLLELSENGELSDQEILDELNTFIAAGTDTMSITLSNTLTCIGSYSAVQARILKELQEVFEGSDRDVEKQDLPRLKYLEAVIKEALRLYPVVPLITRIPDNDIKMKDYTLPAGSKCYIFISALLRHWTWGPDADTFRPERWLDGSVPTNMKGFAAFSLGKRSCIGANFAIMCMKTVLASFLRRYSVKSDIKQMVQEFYITTKPESGHEISIENRK